MANKRRRNRKIRVDFRQNREQRSRSDDWTRRFHAGDDQLDDERHSESVRAKGDLSRKRTVIVGEDSLPEVDESQWLPGIVTKVHGLICNVNGADGRNWECTARRVLRTMQIAQRSAITVGDRVWFADVSTYCDGEQVGVIERVEERRSTLSRRDRRQREHAIVANADLLLAVVSVAQPRPKPHLVDRYLVAAERGKLRPLLCFNKIDLLSDNLAALTEDADGHCDRTLTVMEAIEEFRSLGYECLLTSAVDGTGLDELRAALRGHITVLSGQSGVGKSSLLNAIQPHLALSVREVSKDTEKGRHTTSLAELLTLDFGGYVVDTPGIRAFDLWNIEPGELEAHFVEFVPRVGQCRFSDCSHRHEDGCAIIAAVEAGAISPRRYQSYLKMLAEV